MEQEHEELHREWIRNDYEIHKKRRKRKIRNLSLLLQPQKTHPNKFHHFIYYPCINHYWEWAHCIYMYKNYPSINHCLTFLSMMGMKKSCRFWTPLPPPKKINTKQPGFPRIGDVFSRTWLEWYRFSTSRRVECDGKTPAILSEK